MNTNEKQLIIISASKEELDKERNANRQAELLSDLLEFIGFDTYLVQVHGRYNKVEEESFAVVMPDVYSKEFHRIERALVSLGNKYNQSCLLLVNGKIDPPTAAFYYFDTSENDEAITSYPWIEIDKEDLDALSDDVGYTCIENRYFIIDEDSGTYDNIYDLM